MFRRGADAAALACLFLSGAVGLAYEIAWIRKASLVFGAESFALSTVLAVFFAGLAGGSWLFGRRAARIAHPLRAYAWLEVGVGVLAMLTPSLFTAAERAYGSLYPSLFDDFAALSALRFVGVSAVLLPPTLLMGGTLPLFCQAYVRRRDRIARSVGLLYAVNTLGAAAGCAACGFWLVPRLGVDATVYAGGCLNLAIAAVIFALPLAPPPVSASPTPASVEATAAEARGRPSRWVPWLFFGAGFAALANEVLWSRYLSLLFHNTVHTYTITLTVVLLGIVAGSAVSGRLFDAVRGRALAFGATQVCTALTVLAALHLPPDFWRTWLDPRDLSGQVTAALLLLLPPAFFSGMAFPLAIRMVVDRPDRSGAGVGRMAALNTAGGIAGSLVTGFWVLPSVGLEQTLLWVTGLSLALGGLAWSVLEAGRSGWVLTAVAAALWLAIPPASGVRLPQDHLADREDLIDFEEGLNAFLAVVRGERVVELEIDRMWQGESRKNHQFMAAHVPAILADRLDHVLLVGLGPGQTASRFLLHDVERLDCVELERELPDLVRRHFDSAWMDDPRVEFVIEDGRNFVSHTDRSYDVISIEVGQVFRPGLAGFYTLEFYRRARARLEPGGVLAQFLPIGFFTPDQLRTAIRTFLEVFPDSALWYNHEEMLLLGSDRPLRLGPAGLARLAQPAVRRDMEFAYWGGPREWVRRPEVFLSGFLLGGEALADLAGEAPLYRDDRPHLEYEIPSQGAGREAAIVESIEAHLSPFDVLLAEPWEDAALERAAALRRIHLRDLRARKLTKRAERLAAAGDRQQAERLLYAALEWNPDSRWVRLALGNHLAGQRLPLAAMDEYRRALEIEPDFAAARHNLGNLLLAAGSVDEALAELRAAVASDGELAPARTGLARALLERGDAEAALVQAERAVALGDPPDLDALEALARARAATGDGEGAREAARRALARAESEGLEGRARALRRRLEGLR